MDVRTPLRWIVAFYGNLVVWGATQIPFAVAGAERSIPSGMFAPPARMAIRATSPRFPSPTQANDGQYLASVRCEVEAALSELRAEIGPRI